MLRSLVLVHLWGRGILAVCVSGGCFPPALFSGRLKAVFGACSGTVLRFGGGNGLSHVCRASALVLVSFVNLLQSIGLRSDPLKGPVLRLFFQSRRDSGIRAGSQSDATFSTLKSKLAGVTARETEAGRSESAGQSASFRISKGFSGSWP